MKLSAIFDAPDADVVLRSNSQDVVDFRVHRCILSAASPFFKDMFGLPQPPTYPEDCDNGPPVVDLAEAANVIEALLRFIYPVPNPIIETLDELAVVLAAASKYEATIALDHLRKLLVSPSFAPLSPMRVFSIACQYDFEQEAKIASRYTLTTNLLDTPLSESPELKYISAYSYRRLLDLHRSRADAAKEIIQTAKTEIVETIKCMQCNAVNLPSGFSPPRWWVDFQLRACEELGSRPTTDVVFGMAFLARSARAGCPRCAESLLNSYAFLEGLRRKIDDLPGEI
ncbi:hypothetical protein JAAARDRAFT_116612 [Jaapia argillacea MUCL 33604]|uniref:BTB domain-containing protein n=1 Tax=Jaapia argillacea MUCL 33604 TaxID=933084 RepID=A0A067QKR2_9AGAM|nr:hypothetical protein JAAARDRAFT_116612 [Jaapia argillacea MUCL 33604]